MKRLLLTTGVLALLASPAMARLQLSISDGTTTVSCFDGQLGCDSSGGANNLLVFNTTFDGFLVQLTLAQSSFGTTNSLQLSSSNITATKAGTLTLLASDTDFDDPVTSILESASLTFNSNVGAAASTLKFWAEALNAQGANPSNTPGTLLDTVSGAAATTPDSFSGSKLSAFLASDPFSMTEGAALVLKAGGSVTGFNQSMVTSAVPELQTWAMFGLGLGLVALVGVRKGKGVRSIA